MEQRRVQFTGGSTYTISLPSKWVKEQGLSKGSKLDIIEVDRAGILIRSRKHELIADIPITGNPDIDFITRMLITKYIQGYTSIKIISGDYIHPDIRKSIKGITQRFIIGLEVFDEKANELTFSVLLHEAIGIEQVIDQMMNISFYSLNDVIIAAINNNKDISNDITQREYEIDKFYFLVLRQLFTSFEPKKIAWAQIAKSIERISDHTENIASLYPLLVKKIPPDIISKYKKLPETYKRLGTLIESRDIIEANSVITDIEKFQETETKFLRKFMHKGIDPNLLLILDNFKKINRYLSDIAEAVINLS